MALFLLIFNVANAQCNGYVFKITNGILERYTIEGNYRGSVVRDVMDVDCNKDYIIVLKLDGKVEKYTIEGNYRGAVSSGKAKKVRVAGEMIFITKEDDKVEKYDFNGNYRGML